MPLTETKAGAPLDAASIDDRLAEIVTDLNNITNERIRRRGLGPNQMDTQVVEWPTDTHIEHTVTSRYRNGYPGFGNDTFAAYGAAWPVAPGWLIVNTLGDAGGGSNAVLNLASTVDLVNDQVIGIALFLTAEIRKVIGYRPAATPDAYFGLVHFKVQAQVPGGAWVSLPETDTFWRPRASSLISQHRHAPHPMRLLLRAGNAAGITEVDGFRLLVAGSTGGAADKAAAYLASVDLGAVVIRGEGI